MSSSGFGEPRAQLVIRARVPMLPFLKDRGDLGWCPRRIRPEAPPGELTLSLTLSLLGRVSEVPGRVGSPSWREMNSHICDRDDEAPATRVERRKVLPFVLHLTVVEGIACRAKCTVPLPRNLCPHAPFPIMREGRT